LHTFPIFFIQHVENYTLVKPASWWDTRKTSQQSDAFTIYLATLYTHTHTHIEVCQITEVKYVTVTF